jgi:hypothetical protein
VFRPTRSFDDPVAAAILRFALLTSLLTFLTAVAVFYLCRGFGLSRLLGVLGANGYVGLTFVLAVQGIPHVDAGFFLFFGLAALALQRRNYVLFFGTITMGMFVKEGMLLVGLLVILLPVSLLDRLRWLMLMVPGAAAYALVRFWLIPTPSEYLGSGAFESDVLTALRHIASLNGLGWIFMGFNFLWFPFLYALRACHPAPMLVRWSWSIPVLIVATALFGSDHFARFLLLAFPVVIPLAMMGIGQMTRISDSAGGDRLDEDALVGINA